MLAATATAPVAVSVPSLVASVRRGKSRVVHQVMAGLNSFEGLKAHNRVSALGVPIATEMAFAKVVRSLRLKGKGGGGALGASCSVAGEIFRIAATMNGLVLVGVAVGFVLLRIEASVEEAEAE